MFCTQCGEACAATVRFCPQCGHAVPPEVRAAVQDVPSPPEEIADDGVAAGPEEVESRVDPPRDTRRVIGGVLAALAVLALGGIGTVWMNREREPAPLASDPASAPAPTTDLAAPAAAAVASPPSPLFDANRLRNSVLTLHGFNDAGEEAVVGTAFLVGDGGLAIASLDVVRAATFMRGTLGSGAGFTVSRVLQVDAARSLAVLQIAPESAGTILTPLALGESRVATPGDRVYTISAANGFSNTVSDGVLSGVREIEGVQYLQFSAPIGVGSSGGPMFNAQGQVIGVIQMQATGAQQLNFGVPVEAVVQLMGEPAPTSKADQ